jgi:diguanylate cyclase (GGDEF)-like protein
VNGPEGRLGGLLGRWLRVLSWAVAVGGTGVFAVATPLRAGAEAQVLWLDAGVYAAVYLAAGLLMTCQRSPDPWVRWGWRIFGAGTFLYCLGNLHFSLVVERDPDPVYPAPADYLFLSWYPLAYIAVLLIFRPRLKGVSSGPALDALIAGLGGAAAVLALSLGDVISLEGSSVGETLVNLAYPVSDLLLIVVAVASAWAVGLRLTVGDVSLVLGLGVEAATDVVYLLQEASGTYVEGSWVDLLWLVGLLLITGAFELGREGRTRGRRPPGPRTERGRGDPGQEPEPALPVVPLVSSLGCAVLIGLHQAGRVPSEAMIPADAAVLAALVRAFESVREIRAAKRRAISVLHEQARTDELTGLPNRRALYEHCDSRVTTATSDHPVCLLLFDLDRFKEINDALGHSAGDQLLREMADRVRSILPTSSLLSRLGGDEFAVLVDGPVPTARALAKEVLDELSVPFVVAGTRLHVEASIGVACVPEHAVSRNEVLRFADAAMYDAKRNRTRVVVYASESGSDGAERLRLAEELRGALAGEDPRRNGYLVIHLQPQLVLGGSGEVVGAEALVRWEHPLQGLLMPGAFLPLARSVGIFDGLVDVVLDLALSACRRWWNLGWGMPVSVNMSTSDLHDPAIVNRVSETLRRYGLPGEALVIEVTEETLMADPSGAYTVLGKLRRLGAQVSIDDFGSGYSSFAYLRGLPADELKLDVIFTQDLARDPVESSRPAMIVRTIADLAHSLGLRLVAEGIEDGQCASLLGRLGVDIGQGFHLARPMPLERFLPWTEDNDPRGRGQAAREVTTVIRRLSDRTAR